MRTPKILVAGVAAAPLLILAAPGAMAAPASATESPSKAAATDGTADQKVIVVLRDQHSEAPASKAMAPARAQADTATQSPILADLASSGAKAVKSFKTIDAVSATVTSAEATKLAANPAVMEVVPDGNVTLAEPSAATSAAVKAAGGTTSSIPAGTCSTTTPQLNPEALSTTHSDSDTPGALTARSLGYTGKGVTVAYIAEGIDINNPDFIRADGSHVFSDYQDFSADGPNAPTSGGEAFLDASSIAAQGRVTYDVSGYGQNAVTTPCKIRVEGVAPGASLVGLKVFAENNITTTSDFLQAIDYAVFTDHVDVLNESFGSNELPDTFNDVTRIFDEQAVAAGTTVTASSGDAGVTNTIGSPASDASVISVGASTTYRINLQDGYGGARLPGITGYLDNNISSLSSGGETEAGRTVDLVAPGELNWAVCTPNLALYAECTNYLGKASPVVASGGTSESAPLTAGAAALVIEAYRGSHAGASPTPAQVKQFLVSTAGDISAPADQQGAGLLNSYRAVLAASAAPASTFLIGPQDSAGGDQIDVKAAPGATVAPTFTVTNTSNKAQVVAVKPRRLGDYSPLVSTSVTLADATSPHAPDYSGANVDNYAKVTFTVPAGVDRLDADIAYQDVNGDATDFAGRVRITLVDPQGRLAEYSLPQGAGNFSDSQVADPVAGTWTAYVVSREAAFGGTVGKVLFGARTAKYTSPGTVSPASIKLAPGQVGTFTYTATTPSIPGDSATSLVVTGPSSNTTVPVILRSVLPVTKAGTTFTQTLTGGNGRANFTGQAFYYQLKVPANLAALNATVKLSADPGSNYTIALIDPAGDTVATGGNYLTSTGVDGSTQYAVQKGGVVHALAPTAGVWDLVVNFYSQVQGDRLSTPFTVQVDGKAATVSSSLPSGDTVPAGGSTTGYVHIVNTTSATEQYFVDARLANLVRLPLVVNGATTPLPITGEPNFIVPTNTTSISAAVSASLPVTFDMSSAIGDPDVAAQSEGDTATATYTGAPTTPGVWFLLPSEFGPYSGPAPVGTQTTSVSVLTQDFDPSFTSSTGDLWKQSFDPSSPLAAITVPAGGSAYIPITISVDAKAAPGTVVKGIAYVDDLTLIANDAYVPTGSQVAAFPYSYTVGAAAATTSGTTAGTASGSTKTGTPAT